MKKKYTIYLAADHAGFEMKEMLVEFLEEMKYDVKDLGAKKLDEVDDYPDFVSKAAKKVSKKPDQRKAIILGGSGQGEAMMANRFKNVRAAVFYGGNEKIISLSRQHNDANVLSLGARFIEMEDAKKAALLWLEMPFSENERHLRRIGKIEERGKE